MRQSSPKIRCSTKSISVRLALLSNAHVMSSATTIFLLSNLALGFGFSPVAAAIVTVGVGVSALVFWVERGRRPGSSLAAPIDWRALIACMIVAIALCLLGGEGHLFFATSDWFTRDSVLADLTRLGFPVYYHFNDENYFLRAPLGMYMTPSVVGRLFGYSSAHFALLLQNSFLFGSLLYLISQIT
jgi:hypothetical protein